MKKYLHVLIVSFIICFAFSCKKENDITPLTTPEPSIAGKWKMILYTDSITNKTINKEESIQYTDLSMIVIDTQQIRNGDVEMAITFKDSSATEGYINGHTIKNGFNGNFTITSLHHINASFGWTLSSDYMWSKYFSWVVSYSPDFSYSFDTLNRLLIHSQEGKTVIFEREE